MPLLFLGLLTLAGIGFALSGKKVPSIDTTGMPASLVAQINAAVDSADPVVMRQIASMVRSSGYPAAAGALEEAATNVEAAMNAIAPTRAAVNPAPKADDQAARTLAGKVAGALSGKSAADARASAEVKALVLAFQKLEKSRGFYVGNLDGLYGPKTAVALAQDHGIVPPIPIYWPKKAPAEAKRAYRAALAAYVAADPQRAEEWAQSMNVDAA